MRGFGAGFVAVFPAAKQYNPSIWLTARASLRSTAVFPLDPSNPALFGVSRQLLASLANAGHAMALRTNVVRMAESVERTVPMLAMGAPPVARTPHAYDSTIITRQDKRINERIYDRTDVATIRPHDARRGVREILLLERGERAGQYSRPTCKTSPFAWETSPSEFLSKRFWDQLGPNRCLDGL